MNKLSSGSFPRRNILVVLIAITYTTSIFFLSEAATTPQSMYIDNEAIPYNWLSHIAFLSLMLTAAWLAPQWRQTFPRAILHGWILGLVLTPALAYLDDPIPLDSLAQMVGSIMLVEAIFTPFAAIPIILSLVLGVVLGRMTRWLHARTSVE